jgi:hypothetical protein
MTTMNTNLRKSATIRHCAVNVQQRLKQPLKWMAITTAFLSAGLSIPSHASANLMAEDNHANRYSSMENDRIGAIQRAPAVIATTKSTIANNLTNGIDLTATDSGNGKIFSDIWLTASTRSADATPGMQMARVRFVITAADGTVVTRESAGSSHTVALRGLLSMMHTIRATAFDVSGASIESGVLTIDLRRRPAMLPPPPPPPPPPPANIAPVVNLTAPAANASVTVGNALTINANATDTDGSIAKVEFFAGTTKLGEDTTAPYSFNWTATVAGSYSLTARATDNSGAATTSAAVSVTVNAIVVPPPPPPPPPPPTSNFITLPVEVIGAPGTEAAVTFNLSASQAQQAQRLWLQTHNVRYAEKASVKINNGAWTPLNNTSATMQGTSKTYGGIGGSIATLKMTLPVAASTLVAGINTISFRFNVGNGLTIGYRIVNLNLLDSAGQRLIPAATFVKTDPATWTVPANNSSAADIAIGRSLWSSASLKANANANAANIIARCGDCHTQNGADVKYFGYSNKSIIERAQFHGLTQTQGNQIAAYIRTLPVKAVGRPWNPPYQPGPGTSTKPNDEWAAGAGIDNVLDDDWDTINHIFPQGIKRDALMIGDTNKFKRFSSHDTPIAFQLPDWNHWLPELHPYDAFGKATADGLKSFKAYKVIRQGLEGKTDAQIRQWYRESFPTQPNQDAKGYFAFTNFGGHHLPGEIIEAGLVSPINSDMRVDTPENAKKLYSAQLWKMVKHVELNEEFQLNGMGPETNNVAWAGFDNRQALPRMWVGAERVVFDVSPFLSALKDGLTGSTSGNNDFNYDYLSNAWYQLQIILNAGQRSGGGHRVIDWGYSYGFLNGFDRNTNHTQSARNLIWALKSLDEADNDHVKGPNQPDGWSMRRVDIGNALGINNDFQPSKFWLTQPTPSARAVLTLAQQVVLEKNASWLPIQFSTNPDGSPKSGDEDGVRFYPPDYVVTGVNHEGRNQTEGTYTLLQQLKQLGTYPAAIQNGYAQWAQAVWPGVNAQGVARNNWLQFGVARVGNAPSAPAVAPGTAAGAVNVMWTRPAGTDSVNVKRADSPNGPFLTVAYFRTASSYIDIAPLLGRTYYYRVSSNTGQNESQDSAVVAIAR